MFENIISNNVSANNGITYHFTSSQQQACTKQLLQDEQDTQKPMNQPKYNLVPEAQGPTPRIHYIILYYIIYYILYYIILYYIILYYIILYITLFYITLYYIHFVAHNVFYWFIIIRKTKKSRIIVCFPSHFLLSCVFPILWGLIFAHLWVKKLLEGIHFHGINFCGAFSIFLFPKMSVANNFRKKLIPVWRSGWYCVLFVIHRWGHLFCEFQF